MKSEERYNLSKLTTAQRFQLMFGQKITPTYPMPLTAEQRADIHRDALNFWHRGEGPISLQALADLVIRQYELFHSPTQMERTNHGLQLEIDRLKAELAAVRFWLEEPRQNPLSEIEALKAHIAWLEANSKPDQILTASPSGGFTVENVWSKPTQPKQP